MHYYDSNGRTPFNVNSSAKRLNTADCQDVDDWYLDGFRVGKTFSAYQQSLLQQRINYCQQYGGVSNGLKLAWLQGYKKGVPVQKKQSKKMRKKQART
ncbi:hypothetical protein BKK51_02195 [Rodentibacter trehalosifermentans]|uniref:Uncharacterized protein n=1 Tax=Rodentibacter trehalosifermentans TaxID=1908263 RepID=A0A1V3IX19_9PAST|nr:hypothetical protein BKK51_02195 [Rodentibacter trehalosifermentans]OOF49911.1 hypothetical protein BKK52_02525 [Rodentibacter trehalosifermentans]OOF52711.1 hypothetical protein BKK53_04130 [Rodentibacter trehalosifermentans]